MLEKFGREAARLWPETGIYIWIVWAYLAAGSVLTPFALKQIRARSPGKRIRRVWLMPFAAPFLLVRLLVARAPAPKESETGRIPPPRSLLGGFGAGLFPGLGQLVYGQIAKTLFIWGFGMLGAFICGAYLLGVELTSAAPEWLTGLSIFKEPGKEVIGGTVQLAVPRPLFIVFGVELAVLFLWTYIDAAFAADRCLRQSARLHERRQRTPYDERAVRPA